MVHSIQPSLQTLTRTYSNSHFSIETFCVLVLNYLVWVWRHDVFTAAITNKLLSSRHRHCLHLIHTTMKFQLGAINFQETYNPTILQSYKTRQIQILFVYSSLAPILICCIVYYAPCSFCARCPNIFVHHPRVKNEILTKYHFEDKPQVMYFKRAPISQVIFCGGIADSTLATPRPC